MNFHSFEHFVYVALYIAHLAAIAIKGVGGGYGDVSEDADQHSDLDWEQEGGRMKRSRRIVMSLLHSKMCTIECMNLAARDSEETTS